VFRRKTSAHHNLASQVDPNRWLFLPSSDGIASPTAWRSASAASRTATKNRQRDAVESWSIRAK
jgi:hypothetical protein